MMEDRIRTLEINSTAHEVAHVELTETLKEIRADISEVKQWLSGNGSVMVAVRNKRLRFAGSMSIKSGGIFGVTGVGAVIAAIGKALGWY